MARPIRRRATRALAGLAAGRAAVLAVASRAVRWGAWYPVFRNSTAARATRALAGCATGKGTAMPSLIIHMGTEAPLVGKYIAPTGSDTTGDGTIGNPWRTYGKFYDTAVAGDTLYCRGGTYTSNPGKLVIGKAGTALSPITVRAYPGEVPVFDGNGTSVGIDFRNGADYHILDGLRFQNYFPDQSAIIAISADTGYTCGYLTVRNCQFTQSNNWTNTAHCVYASWRSHHLTVEDCLFLGAYSGGSSGSALNLYHSPGSTDLLFQRNVCVNLLEAMRIWDTAATGSILHNTFIDCDANIDLRYHSTMLVRDNAGEDGPSANIYDPNNSAYTTADHNFWGQSFDANYYLLAGQTGRGAASDGTDAGALDW